MIEENNKKINIWSIIIPFIFLVLISLVVLFIVSNDEKKNAIIPFTSVELKVGETKELNLSIKTDEKLIWESSNPDIVSVDSNGKISAILEGKAEITVKVDEDALAKWEINVVDKIDNKVAVTNIKIYSSGVDYTNKEIKLEKAKTIKLEAKVLPNDATNKGVKWKSSDEKIVKVDSKGNVTGVSNGKAKITIIADDNSKIVASLNVVVSSELSINFNLKGAEVINLNLNDNYLEYGYSADGSDGKSYNNYVKMSGEVNTKKEGTYKIIYELNYEKINKKLERVVNVKSASVSNIKLSKTKYELCLGDKTKIEASIEPGNATNKTLIYEPVDSSILTVTNGTINPLKVGTTTVNIYDSSKKIKKQVTVTINDCYDVVLFFGQSNMIGRCGRQASERNQYDFRLQQLGVSNFSKASGIDSTIVQNYNKLSHVNITIKSQTAYEYKYIPNANGSSVSTSLKEINSQTTTVGERACNNSSGKFITTSSTCTVVNEESSGTNMIPYFAKTYYEQTGHKLLVVYAAVGGKVISRFLPHTRNVEEFNKEKAKIEAYNANLPADSSLKVTISEADKNRYIYEYMVTKFNSAVSYLENKNIVIKNKFYVIFQGENDSALAIRNLRTSEEYRSIIQEVHDNLKKDIKIDYGFVIETGLTVGTTKSGVDKIYNAQKKFISDNKDVYLASSLPYDKYVGRKADYSNLTDTQYKEKAENGKLLYCYSKYESNGSNYQIGDIDESNNIHLNAASLSQIGKDTAIAASKVIKK